MASVAAGDGNLSCSNYLSNCLLASLRTCLRLSTCLVLCNVVACVPLYGKVRAYFLPHVSVCLLRVRNTLSECFAMVWLNMCVCFCHYAIMTRDASCHFSMSRGSSLSLSLS